MLQKKVSRLLALGVFLILILTFVWCIVDNILRSAAMVNAGFIMPVTAVTIVGGMLWLISHGIHGAAIVALPALILRRTAMREEVYAS